MRLLTKVITASVGFAFAVGGFGKASAQEPKLMKDGTVVLAKEDRTPSMSSAEQLRKEVIILAGQAPTKGTKPTKTQTRSPKKPTKGTKK
jgi:hypothetical protein